jgi:hypothetical protein
MAESTLSYNEAHRDDGSIIYDVFLNCDAFPDGIFVAEFVKNSAMDFVGDRFTLDINDCELSGGDDGEGEHTFEHECDAMRFLEVKFMLEKFL